MTKWILACLLGAVQLLGAGTARAQNAQTTQKSFVVIVNQASTLSTMTRSDVSKLFMRKMTKWPNGREVQAIDQVASSPTRRAFSDAVHHMDVPRVKNYWQGIVFSGRGDPPPERASDADVIQFVRSNVGAIGYVSSTAQLSDVKVVAIQN